MIKKKCTCKFTVPNLFVSFHITKLIYVGNVTLNCLSDRAPNIVV